MKSIVYLIIFFATLSSCSPFLFNTLQPVDGQEIFEFPSSLRGSWYCAEDSLGVVVCDSTKGLKIFSTYYELDNKRVNLDDSSRLVKKEDFYVLNSINKNYSSKKETYYEIFIIRDDSSSLTINYVLKPWNVKSAKKMKKSKSISRNTEIDSIDTGWFVPKLLKYNIKLKDLEQFRYQEPIFKLVENNRIINGKDTDGWYSCGEISKRDIRKSKRINRIMGISNQNLEE